jgi:hypothetical protein
VAGRLFLKRRRSAAHLTRIDPGGFPAAEVYASSISGMIRPGESTRLGFSAAIHRNGQRNRQRCCILNLTCLINSDLFLFSQKISENLFIHKNSRLGYFMNGSRRGLISDSSVTSSLRDLMSHCR